MCIRDRWLTCLKDDLRVFGATHGSTDDAPCVFGIPKLVWGEAAKVEGGYHSTRRCYRELRGL